MSQQAYQLVMHAGPTPNKAIELNQDRMTIGRDATNEIVINDPEISRHHARLTAQIGGYILEDIGSTNGTFVGGERLIGPHLLKPGERVQLGGNVILIFQAVQFDPDATIVSSYGLPAYPQSSPGSIPVAPVGQSIQPAQPFPQAVPAQPQPIPYQAYPVTPPPAAVQTPPTYYAGQIPQNPDEIAGEEAEEEIQPRRSKTWIWVGGGCLLVFLCVCIGSAYIFDYLNLYCFPPFDNIFSWLYTCP